MTSLYKVSNPNANGTMCLAEGVEKGFHFSLKHFDVISP